MCAVEFVLGSCHQPDTIFLFVYVSIIQTEVTTLCVFPFNDSNILSASSKSFGLPRTILLFMTTVSALIIIAGLCKCFCTDNALFSAIFSTSL